MTRRMFGTFYLENKVASPEWLIGHDENELAQRVRPKYEEHPTVCNICGGKVYFVSNEKVYGKKYGNGYCYLCQSCWSFVGTHPNAPDIALGILADRKMRDLRKKCHAEAARLYMPEIRDFSRKRQTALYFVLGQWLHMTPNQMHFAKMQVQDLEDALSFMRTVKSMEYALNGRVAVRSIEMKDGSVVRQPILRKDVQASIRKWEAETNASALKVSKNKAS